MTPSCQLYLNKAVRKPTKLICDNCGQNRDDLRWKYKGAFWDAGKVLYDIYMGLYTWKRLIELYT